MAGRDSARPAHHVPVSMRGVIGPDDLDARSSARGQRGGEPDGQDRRLVAAAVDEDRPGAGWQQAGEAAQHFVPPPAAGVNRLHAIIMQIPEISRQEALYA